MQPIYRIFIFIMLPLFLLSLSSGCASTPKKQSIQTKVDNLESEITKLQNEQTTISDKLEDVRENQRQIVEYVNKANERSVTSSGAGGERPENSSNVQTALKNAGFYQGSIDGKLGSKSVEAIKAFQKENNIKSDGKVGPQTWSLLKKYL